MPSRTHLEAHTSRNLFCERKDLRSESDVEALFLNRLLVKLRYPDNRVLRKESLEEIRLGRGSRRQAYRPDYVLLDRKQRPIIVVEAKSPSEKPADYHYQVSGYALALNQRYDEANPVRFTVVSNGLITLVYPWDGDKPTLRLRFADFEEDNTSFVDLRSRLSYAAVDILAATDNIFEFKRPKMDDLIQLFDECHDLIWRKQKVPPTDAFYEFAKLMFVKLREDQRIAEIVAGGRKTKGSDFNFRGACSEEQASKGVDDNPVANILFRRVRDDLEEKISRGEKKRIFLKDEPL